MIISSFRIALQLGLFLTSVHAAIAAPVMTPFKPERHGFKFVNTFNNDAVPELDIRTGGLCGGMAYSALDYFGKSAEIPNQDYRPANRTTLQQYLYGRQVNSIEGNLDKWAEVGFNPGGARDVEFFNWGLQAGSGGRITELRAFIDRGKPVPLGLQAAKTGSHQVVAVGYDLGRYRGDLGDFIQDFKIFVYDPNYPGRTMTLTPRVSDHTYTYVEDSQARWRTYFVDAKYSYKNPPNLPNPNYPKDGSIRELLLQFYTGNDDLRGGNDNVNVTVKLKSGVRQVYNNVNLSARWLSNYNETTRIVLSQPVTPDSLESLEISTTFAGGISGDNWDMAKLIVRAIGGGYDKILKQQGYNRFTGDHKTLTVPLNSSPGVPVGHVNQVIAVIKTGGDDLRGGNDNLNITVFFKDGDKQQFNNINGSGRWADNTEKTEKLILKKAVKPEEIIQVTLTTTFGGGIGGDNWNMDSLLLRATGNAVDVQIGSYGFKRFTGDSKTLNILTHP